MKITIYSCVTANYDKVQKVDFLSSCIDSYILFTDSTNIYKQGWDFRALASPYHIKSPNLINRYHKFFPHRVLPDVDISIYIDGNIKIIDDLSPLIDEFIASDNDIGVLTHPQRKNIVEEIGACLNLNKFDENDQSLITEQIESYVKQGYKLNSRLYAATILLRKHRNTKLLDDSMSLWWEQINTYTSRDQISLPYVLWKSKLPFDVYNIDIFNNSLFLRVPHDHQISTLINKVKYKFRKFYKVN